MAQISFNVIVNQEDDGSYWAEVKELPGCFASGFSMDELKEALFEAMQMSLPAGITLEEATWTPVSKKPSRASGKQQMLVCA